MKDTEAIAVVQKMIEDPTFTKKDAEDALDMSRSGAANRLFNASLYLHRQNNKV